MKELIKKLDSLKKPEIFGDHDYQDVLVWNAAIDIAIAKANEAYEPPKDVKEAIEKKWSQDINALMEQHSIGFDQAEALAFEHGIYRRNALFGANLMAMQQKEEWVKDAIEKAYKDGVESLRMAAVNWDVIDGKISAEEHAMKGFDANDYLPAPPSINNQKG